jgi:transposase
MPGVRFSAEQRAKAVRLVAEAAPQHESPWAAIESVAAKIGASAETVRKWVRRAEVDAGQRPGMTSEEHAEIKRLRREVAELRRATEIISALPCSRSRITAICRSSGRYRSSPTRRFAPVDSRAVHRGHRGGRVSSWKTLAGEVEPKPPDDGSNAGR